MGKKYEINLENAENYEEPEKDDEILENENDVKEPEKIDINSEDKDNIEEQKELLKDIEQGKYVPLKLQNEKEFVNEKDKDVNLVMKKIIENNKSEYYEKKSEEKKEKDNTLNIKGDKEIEKAEFLNRWYDLEKEK